MQGIKVRMSDCGCFSSALRTSEDLERIESRLLTASFDAILLPCRTTTQSCQQFTTCTVCSNSHNFDFHVGTMQFAVKIMRQVTQVTIAAQSSPAGASGTSPTTNSTYSAQVETARVRVGSFETEITLDRQTKLTILQAEFREASTVAAQLGQCLGPDSTKRSRIIETDIWYQNSWNSVNKLRASIDEPTRWISRVLIDLDT